MHVKILELGKMINLCLASHSLILRFLQNLKSLCILVDRTTVVEPLLCRGSWTMDSVSLVYPLTVMMTAQHVQAVTSNYRCDKVSAVYSISLHVCVGQVCERLGGAQACFPLTSRIAFQMEGRIYIVCSPLLMLLITGCCRYRCRFLFTFQASSWLVVPWSETSFRLGNI